MIDWLASTRIVHEKSLAVEWAWPHFWAEFSRHDEIERIEKRETCIAVYLKPYQRPGGISLRPFPSSWWRPFWGHRNRGEILAFMGIEILEVDAGGMPA